MKAEIHPEYQVTNFRCACGATIETRSTLQGGDVQVDICSKCHPFFTGKQRVVDTAGRIDRFKKKFGTKIALGSTKKQKNTVSLADKLKMQQELTEEDKKKK